MAKTKSKMIAVRVSPTIAADYARRDIFPTLRATGAYRLEGIVTYQVPRKVATEMLEDAKAQHGREFTREERGIKKSYRALIDVLDAQLDPSAAKAPKAPQPLPTTTCAQPGRLTLAAITNRRVEPSGLIVEDYSPRCKFYAGTKRQIQASGALPKGTVLGAERRWDDGDITYTLDKKRISGSALEGHGDLWELRVFDNRYHFDDYLNRLAA